MSQNNSQFKTTIPVVPFNKPPSITIEDVIKEARLNKDPVLKVSDMDTAIRYNEGKLDWSLIPWDSVEEILKVLEFGKIKYSAWNWNKGEGFKYTDVFNSMVRHLFAWIRGQDNDPESGLNHMAHVGCNVLFILYFIKHKNRYKDNDDRNGS